MRREHTEPAKHTGFNEREKTKRRHGEKEDHKLKNEEVLSNKATYVFLNVGCYCKCRWFNCFLVVYWLFNVCHWLQTSIICRCVYGIKSISSHWSHYEFDSNRSILFLYAGLSNGYRRSKPFSIFFQMVLLFSLSQNVYGIFFQMRQNNPCLVIVIQ